MKRSQFLGLMGGTLAISTTGVLDQLMSTLAETDTKMPVLFVGHGSPMNAIEDNEFTKGWKHELEHTDDIDKAKEIALDHLAEDPNYYTRLDMIEFKAKKKKGRADLPVEVKKKNFVDKDNQMKNAPKKKGVKKS